MSRIAVAEGEGLPSLSPDQVEALRAWVEASREAPGWLDGFGPGRSYIDPRSGRGGNYRERRAYVRFDHETAKRVPQLRGQKWRQVEKLLQRSA